MTDQLPYVKRDTDRNGKVRLYFRSKGMPLVSLPSPEGSPAFVKKYASCIARRNAQNKSAEATQTAANASRVTVHDLVLRYYQSSNFKMLKASTKRTYRCTIDQFCEEHGHRYVDEVSAPALDAIVSRMSHKPAAANKLIKRLPTLMNFAVKLGTLAHNPATVLDFFPTGTIHTWTANELASFKSSWPKGSRPRLAFMLHLYTGQRRSDVVNMRWSDIQDGSLHLIQEKTGTELLIPLHPTLLAELKVCRGSGDPHRTIVATARGKAFTANGYGNWFRRVCKQAGLPKRCTSHGLRKAAATALAEAGCSSHEIMAITGHKSLADVELYTRAVNQKRMAKIAIDKLVSQSSDTPDQETLSHDNDNYTITDTYGDDGGPGGTRTPNQAVMSRRL